MKRNLYTAVFLLLIIGGVIFCCNYSIFTIMSGSMEPVIKTGSIVIVKTNEDYQPGDIITYAIGKNFVTHRISKQIDINEYITKGDANISSDPVSVDSSMINGKVVMTIPLIGYISLYLKQHYFLMIIILAVYLLEEKWKRRKKSY